MEKKDIKVKKEHIVAKLLCGSLIPIVGVTAICGVAYHVYWQASEALECYLFEAKDGSGDYIWEGNVDRAIKFKFQIEKDTVATELTFDRFELTVDNQPVKIKKIVDIWTSEKPSLTWTIEQDGSIKAADDNNNIVLPTGNSKYCNIIVSSDFKGHVIAKLHPKQA